MTELRTLPLTKPIKPESILHTYTVVLSSYKTIDIDCTNYITEMPESSDEITTYVFYRDKSIVFQIDGAQVMSVMRRDVVNPEEYVKKIKPTRRKKL
jgi:hypothetical protein